MVNRCRFRLLLSMLCVCVVTTAMAQHSSIVDVAEEWDPIAAQYKPLVRLVEQGRDVRVTLSSWTKRVERSSVYGGRVLLIGMSSVAESLSVVSRSSGALEDEFLAYKTSVSPNGRYVAFERFWQPHGPNVSPVVMLYDLEATARGNRVEDVRGLNALQYVGRPIYPIDQVHLREYQNPPRSDSRPRRLSQLFWLDEELLAFISYVPGQSQLVVVSGRPHLSQPQHESYPLDHNSVINLRALGHGDDPAKLFSSVILSASRSRRDITIQLGEGSEYKVRSLTVRRW